MFSAEQLLSPISPAAPSGEDLAFSPELDAIAQARRFDDPSLDQGEWVTELKEADWDFVVRRCAALLQEKSKDLRLAVWLAEAGAKTSGLRGLGQGYRVIAGLCREYWDQGLYPESDGDDHDQRIGNLSWILARTPALVREIPLTEGRGSAYSTIDFDTARKQASGQGGVADPTGVRLADMEAARRNNTAQFNSAMVADAQECLDALRALEEISDERLGPDSPGFSAARDAIVSLQRTLPAAAMAAAAEAPAAPDDGGTPAGHYYHDPADSAPATPPLASSGPPGTIQTRAQALAQLRAVAQFFRRTEPHSPVSYFADKAADSGEQTLHDWLRSVVKDSDSMRHIEELLGVKSDN
ncbi:type VI secretion protein [Duganella sp. Leaf126]|uniref:type VI secretion system protein TssA n=1 Tax=Duganella sp. Leaf126 TaxID=1736266 RepID=UPI0006FD057A|nr:type VI secretion system protein TssA [Duganella sp. Leaf126]KQQ44372.1 type VI secretion protein [Duganella sp. Leaf126]